MTIPRKPIFGAKIDPASVGPRQVASMPSSKAIAPPIQVDKLFRNGKHPQAQAWNQIMEATNQGALLRTRQLFWAPGITGTSGVSSILNSQPASRARYRFAFRTSPYAHALYVMVNMMPPDQGAAGAGLNQNTYGRLRIYSDTAESATVSTSDFYYGASPMGTDTSFAPGWQYVKTVTGFVDGLSASTDYYAKFSDENYGRIHSATVIELHSMSENFSGYLPQNLTGQTEILDKYRERTALIQTNLWKYAGAHVLNWTRDDGGTSRSSTSATATNLNVDGSSTTYGASIPGYNIDMSNKARLSQSSGVPVIMKVYGLTNSAGGEGRLILRDSAGSAVLTMSGGWSTGGYTWQSTTGFLPATADKYYLTFYSTGGGITFQCRAVSIWEYEA